MLDREFWEEYFGDEETARRIAAKLTALDLSEDPIKRGLEWMADLQEADRFSGMSHDERSPAWRRDENDPERFSQWWTYDAWGLSYKGTGSYLTSEGWPLGTRCWYVTINLGWRERTCSPTPELAVYRALILTHVALAERATHPKKRRHLEDALASVSGAMAAV